jgi:hypothetical protein
MRKQRRRAICLLALGMCVAAGAVAALRGARGADISRGVDSASIGDGEARAAAVAAYVYGYPLVTMEMTRRVMTNASGDEGKHAPMGQFAQMRTFPTAGDTDVTAPDADTLEAAAWLDLSKEPYVISVPAMKGRYFLLSMLDAWTEVLADPGSRTTGTGAQKYAITGPAWKAGKLPPGVTEVKSPTSLVWILGRIDSSGTPQDFDEVHALQDRMSLAPLSAYDKPYRPPPGSVDRTIDMNTSVRDQVDRLDAPSFFGTMVQLMATNPPSPADRPLVDAMAKIGIVPGQPFDTSKLSPAVVKALRDAPRAGQERIKRRIEDGTSAVNGWIVMGKTGRYGTDYLQRAFATAVGLGADRPEDTVYPASPSDAEGRPFEGTHKYVLHLEKGQMPPVRGSWSLSMYASKLVFVPNPLNRYRLGQHDKLRTNPDGSIDLFVQKEPPAPEREANWLPAPAGKFVLMFRLYWPNETAPTILDGSWKPPAVKRVE